MLQNDNRAIIRPRRGRNDPQICSTVVIAFTKEDWIFFKEICGAGKYQIKEVNNAFILNGSYHGEAVTIAGPLVGAPHAILMLEKLIALGAGVILAYGWCGSIHPSARIGDIVLPASAVSEEGTSKHYAVDQIKIGPGKNITQHLLNFLPTKKITLHRGLVWTTDAPYRETVKKVLKYQEQGVIAVDMETSALLQVAAFRGIEMSVVLIVSDELFSLKWRHGFKSGKFNENRRLISLAILDAVSTYQKL